MLFRSTLDGAQVYETTLGGDEDSKAYDQIQDGVMEKVNARLKNIRFKTAAGPHKVGVTFKRRTFAESDDQQQLFVPGGGQDRVFRVSSFEISGPYEPTGLSMTPSRERIFSCRPSRPEDEQACAEKILTDLAKRAYRRPVAEQDVAELLEYYRDGHAVNGFEEGIRSGITGILASPYFLYRVEHAPEGVKPGETYTYEFVARTSGSHMYHSHHNATDQVGRGLLGAFIVDPKDEAERYATKHGVTQEIVFIHNDSLGGFTINGHGFPATVPVLGAIGERVRIRFMNEGVMTHPFHLHGFFFQPLGDDGQPPSEVRRYATAGGGSTEMRYDKISVFSPRIFPPGNSTFSLFNALCTSSTVNPTAAIFSDDIHKRIENLLLPKIVI